MFGAMHCLTPRAGDGGQEAWGEGRSTRARASGRGSAHTCIHARSYRNPCLDICLAGAAKDGKAATA